MGSGAWRAPGGVDRNDARRAPDSKRTAAEPAGRRLHPGARDFPHTTPPGFLGRVRLRSPVSSDVPPRRAAVRFVRISHPYLPRREMTRPGGVQGRRIRAGSTGGTTATGWGRRKKVIRVTPSAKHAGKPRHSCVSVGKGRGNFSVIGGNLEGNHPASD